MLGKMSTLGLIDRYSQAHCWRACAQAECLSLLDFASEP